MTAIDFAAFVDELAAMSGETIRPFFRSALSVENKSRSGGFDPVTAADRAAESAMRALIKRTFPEHGIVGEELGADRPDAEYVWVLDPIDGTKSFISGLPTWGTLIGLLHNGEPVYGINTGFGQFADVVISPEKVAARASCSGELTHCSSVAESGAGVVRCTTSGSWKGAVAPAGAAGTASVSANATAGARALITEG